MNHETKVKVNTNDGHVVLLLSGRKDLVEDEGGGGKYEP